MSKLRAILEFSVNGVIRKKLDEMRTDRRYTIFSNSNISLSYCCLRSSNQGISLEPQEE